LKESHFPNVCGYRQVEKYQEQGQLVEPLLEGIITPVMDLVRATVIEAKGNKLGKSQLQVC
jgi:hypothetical protein